MSSSDSSFWKEAVNSEIDSILSNHTWELVDLPPGNKPLGSKWIFKRKMKANGTIDKYKARLVVKGFKQKEGLDYFDTYSPVTRITSIRMLIALAAVYNLQIQQMNVKTAFLNGDLEEEIYMEQPEGFVVPGKENKITIDYVKSKDNVSDPLTKGLSREGVERTSKGMGLRPRTSQHGGCHFLHYVPGGLKAVTQMLVSNPALPATSRNLIAPPSFPDGASPPAVKTRLCSKYNTAEGCKFGEKCRFSHGDWELGRPAAPLHEESHGMFQMHGRYGSRPETNPAGLGAAASFGSSATAKISVDASLAGRIIGKGGVNSKQICRVTGAKLSIRDHELDPNLRNIELEGTIDQLEQASRMVRELIQSVTTSVVPPKNTGSSATKYPYIEHMSVSIMLSLSSVSAPGQLRVGLSTERT
ncbi:Zinc finger CCCH domain-containing protein 14 [Capsicum chinense]|nr:Zinc finger CCCH domain-containing protein 14 [Capsicum chinense]